MRVRANDLVISFEALIVKESPTSCAAPAALADLHGHGRALALLCDVPRRAPVGDLSKCATDKRRPVPKLNLFHDLRVGAKGTQC